MDYRVQPSNIVSVARPTGEEGYLGSSEQRNGRQSDACFTKAARAGALWRQRRPEGREGFGELIAKNGFANFMDGADRNELAVATLLWQRQQGQQ